MSPSAEWLGPEIPVISQELVEANNGAVRVTGKTGSYRRSRSLDRFGRHEYSLSQS